MSSEGRGEKTIICRCEDVALEEVERAIDEGYATLEGIKRLLKCGMGSCQGRTCLRLIAGIISRKTGKPVSEMRFPTVRPPIRPVPLAVFAAGKRKR
jgi:NAD(P)H-nitrite reductase large subunit